MEILNIVQGSDEWFAARIGSLGGSSIADAVAGGTGKTRKTLMYRMAGEILSGQKYNGYQNADMLRGLEQEPDARSLYELVTGSTIEQVGLIKNGKHFHCSPDGVIGDDGLLEIKSVLPHVHIETIIANEVPSEYRKQCQWSLGITERRWIDFVSYSPTVIDKPIWIVRRERDEKLIDELFIGAEKFIDEMLSIVKKVKAA